MGLALGKSIAEIRQLGYPEFKRWRLYEAIEPFGWPEKEYHFASLMALIYNLAPVKKKPLTPADFIVDIDEVIANQEKELVKKKKFAELTTEEKREYILDQFKKRFLVNDNRRDNIS